MGGEKCWQPLLRAEFWNRISSASCGRSDKSLNLRHTQPQPLARATVCSTFGNKTEQWPGTQDNERGRKRKGPGWRCVGLSTGSECRSTQQPPLLQDSSGPLHPLWPVRPKWKGYKIDTRFAPSLRGWKGEHSPLLLELGSSVLAWKSMPRALAGGSVRLGRRADCPLECLPHVDAGCVQMRVPHSCPFRPGRNGDF